MKRLKNGRLRESRHQAYIRSGPSGNLDDRSTMMVLFPSQFMMPISRSVGNYRPRAALLAVVTALGALLGVLVSPGGASPKPDEPPTAESRRIGMNSCGGRGCHGAVGAVKPAEGEVYIRDGASTTWLYFDPHAKAYDVLLDDRSAKIAEKLKIGDAHKSGLCLSCHATSSPPEPISPGVELERNGIDCEACHGGAEKWLDAHLLPEWRAKPAAIKAQAGLNDLSTPAARARLCVECHVGNRSRGMDMNHDLIAAGHPRLNFEFAAYQAAYPKHWKEAHEKSPAKEPGRLTSRRRCLGRRPGHHLPGRAGTALRPGQRLGGRQAEERPGSEAVWPEFSEYECFACHHNLTNPRAPSDSGPHPGQAGPAPLADLAPGHAPEVAKGRDGIKLDSLTKLQAEMNRIVPDASESGQPGHFTCRSRGDRPLR